MSGEHPMKIARRKARVVRIGHVPIGGNYPVAIQSMVKTKTAWVEKVVKENEENISTSC